MDFLERTSLVNDKATRMYAFSLDSVDLQQKPVDKDQRSGEKPEDLESRAIHHCHGDAKATESSADEQVHAKWKLCAASGICFLFMIAEVVGGHVAGSLAVVTDAAHLFIDLASFLLSLFSLWLSSKPPSKRLTFGWHRAEILGALLSILGVWAVTGVLVYLACERLLHPDYQIQATVMIIVSGCAVAANIVLSVILHQRRPGHHHKEVPANASVRAAFVHALGDLFQSISVLASALIIYFKFLVIVLKIHISGKGSLAWVLYLLLGRGRIEHLNDYPTNIIHNGGEVTSLQKPDYKMADPICTFVFSVLVLASTVTILKDFSILLMEGVPKSLNYNGVKELILAVDGVVSVHSLHIWSLTMNQVILSAHVAAAASRDSQGVRREIANALSNSFPVHSLTIQVESPADQDPSCLLCEEPRD